MRCVMFGKVRSFCVVRLLRLLTLLKYWVKLSPMITICLSPYDFAWGWRKTYLKTLSSISGTLGCLVDDVPLHQDVRWLRFVANEKGVDLHNHTSWENGLTRVCEDTCHDLLRKSVPCRRFEYIRCCADCTLILGSSDVLAEVSRATGTWPRHHSKHKGTAPGARCQPSIEEMAPQTISHWHT